MRRFRRSLLAASFVVGAGACYSGRPYAPQASSASIARVHIAFDSTSVDLRDATVQDSIFTGALEGGSASVEYLGPTQNGRPVVRVDARHAREIRVTGFDARRTNILVIGLGVLGLALVAAWSRATEPVMC